MNVLLVAEGEHEASGALETLVKRLAPKVRCTWQKVSDVGLRTVHGKGGRLFKRAMGWAFEARKRGFQGLVLVIDEDERGERIAEITRAQEDQSLDFPRALGVAIHAFDAWMLADEQALSAVLGVIIQTQKSPETIRDPKAQCSKLISEAACELSQRAFYAKLAETLNLERLEQRCTKGFGPFAERLRNLATQ